MFGALQPRPTPTVYQILPNEIYSDIVEHVPKPFLAQTGSKSTVKYPQKIIYWSTKSRIMLFVARYFAQIQSIAEQKLRTVELKERQPDQP